MELTGVSRKRWILIASLLLLVAMLASMCLPWKPPKQFRAITDTIPPCWRGICPGQTTKALLWDILHSLPEVSEGEIADSHPDSPVLSTGWRFDGARVPWYGITNCLYGHDAIAYCSFRYGGHSLRLRHVIGKFGEPEYLVPVVDSGDGPFLVVHAVYPRAGVIATLGPRRLPQDGIDVKPSDGVVGYDLFDPTLFDDLLAAPYWLMQAPPEEVERSKLPWLGYGSYAWTPPSP